MLKNIGAIKKQSGKIVVPAAPVVNASKSIVLKYSDTPTYQVGAHGDYVQETN